MAEKPKETASKATIIEYRTPHVAIARIGGKTFRVNIPANSDHPALGDCELKDKWNRVEYSKDDAAAFDARRKEFAKLAEDEKLKDSEK